MSFGTEHQETHLVLEAGEPLNNIFNEVSFLLYTIFELYRFRANQFWNPDLLVNLGLQVNESSSLLCHCVPSQRKR